MANLLTEYRRRHKLDFVWAINGGVCFFINNGQPPLIGLISDNTRSVDVCKNCSSLNTSLVIEFYNICGIFFDQAIKSVYHSHIMPDEDVLQVVKRIAPGYRPYTAKTQRDVEIWLWSVFVSTKPFGTNRKWRIFREEQMLRKDSYSDKVVTEMLLAAKMFGPTYKFYYDRIYVPLLLGRKYMLMR